MRMIVVVVVEAVLRRGVQVPSSSVPLSEPSQQPYPPEFPIKNSTAKIIKPYPRQTLNHNSLGSQRHSPTIRHSGLLGLLLNPGDPLVNLSLVLR